MSHPSSSFSEPDYARPAIEALLVDREALIRFMRLALEEMHSRRRR